MRTLKQMTQIFLDDLGVRLEKLGFPAKVNKKTLFFQQETPIGVVGIHVNPIIRLDEIDFSLRCAISVACVQERLVQTELYANEGGLTWTCGALLKEMRRYQGGGDNIPSHTDPDGKVYVSVESAADVVAKYGTDDGCLHKNDREDRLAEVSEQIFQRIISFGWPILKRFGWSREAFLELTLQTDQLAELMFLDPIKPLAGLIVAEQLGDTGARGKLIRDAVARYESAASHGNIELLDQFKRVGMGLGLFTSGDLRSGTAVSKLTRYFLGGCA